MEALIKDFKEELERIDCPNLERAFLKWFIKTKFGDVTYEITDGKHDGGIDAIIKVNDTTFVIQSKFNQAIFNNRTPPALSVSIYSEFDKLPKTFKDDDLLEVYLKTVTTSLHSQYKEIAKAIKNQKSVIWYLITLCGRSLAGERRLHNLDVANFQYYTQILRLFDISQEGGTPPPINH